MPHAAPVILIADDEMDIRAMLRILLERDGYRIIEARNGEEAVAVCQQQMPDVVLMDILMPVMDGAAACAHIQALPDGDRLPVLMITALNDKQSIDRCFDAGATDYLTKPINNQVLRRRVRRLLRTRQAEEALRANEARLASIINTATDAIILTDEERRISLFNPAAERMFGWTVAEISGQPIAQLIPRFDGDPCGESRGHRGGITRHSGRRVSAMLRAAPGRHPVPDRSVAGPLRTRSAKGADDYRPRYYTAQTGRGRDRTTRAAVGFAGADGTSRHHAARSG